MTRTSIQLGSVRTPSNQRRKACGFRVPYTLTALCRIHFKEGPWGLLIRLEFNARALSPGWHGAHMHQNGDCADFAAGFMASGGHVGKGMDGAMHGLLNPAGPEAGDLPNIFAPDAGAFGAELFSPNITLAAVAQDWRMPLLGPKGAALIVHASPDDHATQPIGGAGARVACAALRP